MAKLTEGDMRLLRKGTLHPHGVMNPSTRLFNRANRQMAKLVGMGLATPNAHGDWYITAEGREIILASAREAFLDAMAR